MKVLVLTNLGMGLYKFRKELLEELVQQGYEVTLAMPHDEYVSIFEALSCKFVEVPLDRRGTNFIADFKTLISYMKIIRIEQPDIVLTYTVKPNVYGGMACAWMNVPYIANVTGLGTAFERKNLLSLIAKNLYRFGLRKAQCVFFQNNVNMKFFTDNCLIKRKKKLIPGSGVNLKQYAYSQYPPDDTIRFLFIGRIMKAKGVEELFEAARFIKSKYKNVYFDIIGFCEESYQNTIDSLHESGIVVFHGKQSDVRGFIQKAHAVIHPSYHEGLSNVLLESAAMGRPVLASNVPGCIETFNESQSGFGFEVKNAQALIDAIERFISLPHQEKKAMGESGRIKVENEFSRDIVVASYLEEIRAKGDNHESIRFT